MNDDPGTGSTIQTHGPSSGGGFESFLHAAEAASLYGQIDLIGGEYRGSLSMVAGRLVLDGVLNTQDREAAVHSWRAVITAISNGTSGGYRCGPLLNRPNADRLVTVSIRELLGAPDRRSTGQPSTDLPTRIPGQNHAVPSSPEPRPKRRPASFSPAQAIPLDAMPAWTPAEPPRANEAPTHPSASARYVDPGAVRPEPAPQPPQDAYVSRPPTGDTPMAETPMVEPKVSGDSRPLRASQLRRILNSLDESETNDASATRVLQDPADAAPSRRSALRSIIRNLASN